MKLTDDLIAKKTITTNIIPPEQNKQN